MEPLTPSVLLLKLDHLDVSNLLAVYHRLPPPLGMDNYKYASIEVNQSAGTVSVLTSMSVFQRPTQARRPIPDILRSWHNPGLWNELECDGDGWWIC